MDFLIRSLGIALLSIFLLFFIYSVKQRRKKKIIYPIKSINMGKNQREYVLAELSKATHMSMFYPINIMSADYYRGKIIQHQVKDEDLEGLNKCLNCIGLYICGLKVY